MGITDLKKKLKELDHKDLIDLIINLYQVNKSVKEQLDFHFMRHENEILLIYKKKVLEAFYPKHGDQFHLKIGKQAISDFKKLKPNSNPLIDLEMYYVECGVRFTMEYGDINENFYNSVAKVYLEAMKLIDTYNLYGEFRERAFKVVTNSANIGWGFHDELADTYGQIYQE
ncbi:MAG: DUF6155 family protein [Bacteroidetes bacterium]|nr:DUF6155 family protein [Bacteroidota bacterium]